MALINPGLAEQLASIITTLHQREVAADDNTLEGYASKDAVCAYTATLTEYLERPDGSNALDYEDEDRNTTENLYKAQVVRLVDWLIRLLDTKPVRTCQEKTELNEILMALQTTENTDWHPEIVKLGNKYGITVELAQANSGTASFATADGIIIAYVYKARTPDVMLDAVNVYLVEELPEAGIPEPTGQYVVMVDDQYWGRRIEPAAFAPAPFERHVATTSWCGTRNWAHTSRALTSTRQSGQHRTDAGNSSHPKDTGPSISAREICGTIRQRPPHKASRATWPRPSAHTKADSSKWSRASRQSWIS
jgi:hypothetical protein